MRVEVTQKDIDKSPGSGNCPIEVALIRDFGAASVSRQLAYLVVDGKTRQFNLPPVAKEFVLLYDHERKVDPISFDMEESCED